MVSLFPTSLVVSSLLLSIYVFVFVPSPGAPQSVVELTGAAPIGASALTISLGFTLLISTNCMRDRFITFTEGKGALATTAAG